MDQAALKAGWSALRIMEAVSAEGVPCYQGSCSEIYREKAFLDEGLGPDKPLPVAARLADSSLMFLVHPTLAEADMRDAARALAKVMRAAARA